MNFNVRLVCLALLACATICQGRYNTEESELKEDIEELGDSDVDGDMSLTPEISDVNGEYLLSVLAGAQEQDLERLLTDCSKGRCHFCKKVAILNVCVDAGLTIKSLGIDMTVKVNGHRIFRKEISVRNPPAVCFNRLPVLKRASNLCLKFYDVNLKDKRGCLKVTFKLLVKKFAAKIGCFHIPADDLEAVKEEDADTDGNLATLFV